MAKEKIDSWKAWRALSQRIGVPLPEEGVPVDIHDLLEGLIGRIETFEEENNGGKDDD